MADWTTHWTPWTEMNRLQGELQRLFGGKPETARRTRFPEVNVWEGDDRLILSASLPGIELSKIDLTVSRDSVTLRGGDSANELKDEEQWHRRERSSGAFDRTIELPFEVDPDKTDAVYEKGVLTLELHRPEEHKPKKVTIKSS